MIFSMVRKNLSEHHLTGTNVSLQRISVTKSTPGCATQIHHLSIIVLAPITNPGQAIGFFALLNGTASLTRNIVVFGSMEYLEQARLSLPLT